ncbi:MAG: hypothetical protein HGA28_02205 [Anaerolineaceae bacterium]|nr:hypothetical protein [Anaerolineaceae bacterium]
MSSTFTVEGKVAGQKRPVFSDWRLELPPQKTGRGDSLKLRDLISSIVAREVEAFRNRQQARRLALVMSSREIEKNVKAGKVVPGERDFNQTVDLDDAVGVALQAFVDGLYFVFIDEVQQTDLDGEVFLKADSRVVFLRLTALAGG